MVSQTHSRTEGQQESGEIWTAETLLQPIRPKPDRLLGCFKPVSMSYTRKIIRLLSTINMFCPDSH